MTLRNKRRGLTQGVEKGEGGVNYKRLKIEGPGEVEVVGE